MPKKLPFLSDDHHYAIAHVATRAAQLEHAIEYSVDAQLLLNKGGAECIIKRSSQNFLVDFLGALLRDNFPSRIAEIETLMADIKAAKDERNEVMHWLWGKGEDEATATIGSQRIHRPEAVKTKTASEVYAIANRLLDATHTLIRLNDDVLRSAWPDEPWRFVPHSPPPIGGLIQK